MHWKKSTWLLHSVNVVKKTGLVRQTVLLNYLFPLFFGDPFVRSLLAVPVAISHAQRSNSSNILALWHIFRVTIALYCFDLWRHKRLARAAEEPCTIALYLARDMQPNLMHCPPFFLLRFRGFSWFFFCYFASCALVMSRDTLHRYVSITWIP